MELLSKIAQSVCMCFFSKRCVCVCRNIGGAHFPGRFTVEQMFYRGLLPGMSVVIDGCGFVRAKPGQECLVCLVWNGEKALGLIGQVVSCSPPKVVCWMFVCCLFLEAILSFIFHNSKKCLHWTPSFWEIPRHSIDHLVVRGLSLGYGSDGGAIRGFPKTGRLTPQKCSAEGS